VDGEREVPALAGVDPGDVGEQQFADRLL